MKERIYLVRQEAAGWTVSVSGQAIAQPFERREAAIAAASSAVNKSRAEGCYAWIKVMQTDETRPTGYAQAPPEANAAGLVRGALAGIAKLLSR